LISAEPSINIETLAKKVVGIFTTVKWLLLEKWSCWNGFNLVYYK
jgi:hypothetical protein